MAVRCQRYVKCSSLAIVDCLPVITAQQATLESWSASSVIDLHMIEGGYPNGSCASLDGYVHVCNGNYGKTTWNGKSQWSYYIEDGGHEGHIFSCVVLLNDNEWVYGEESKVLCHELGHCLVRTVWNQCDNHQVTFVS